MEAVAGVINPRLKNVSSRPALVANQAAEVMSPNDSVTWSGGYGNGLIRSPFATGTAIASRPASAPKPLADIGSVAPSSHSASHKVFGAVALGLTGLGIVGGMVAMPQPAFAATISTTQTATQVDNGVRIQTPVYVQSVQQAANQFDHTHQLYVVGHPALNGVPLSSAELARYGEVLKNHPNAYVILIDKTTDLSGDDMTLSRGIGNSAQFQAVVNQQTGQRDGVLMMVYHNVNGDSSQHKIFMRAQDLTNQLGVGTDNFAAPDGSPREGLNVFLNAYKTEGKDIPGALDEVFQWQDNAINKYVQQTVGGAQQSVQSAQTALDGVQPKIKQFQNKYGTGGALGSPDVAGWKQQLAQADAALQNKDFATATKLSQNVLSAVRGQETAMANYGQAPALAAQAQQQLAQIQGELGSLAGNGHTAAAKSDAQTAASELQAFKTAYQAKDPSFQDHLQKAQEAVQQGAQEVSASRSETATVRNVELGAAATVTLAVLATSVVMNRRAAAKGKQAQKELDEAVKDIGDKSNQLIELLNTADFHEVAGYQGKTKQLADQLREDTVDALTLVGGAQKFLDEAQGLVHPKGPKALANLFLTRNFNDAIELLTDPNKKISFGLADAARAEMEKGSKAETWREQLLAQGDSRQFQKSLKDVLVAMADDHDKAQQILSEIEQKGSDINQYLDKVTAAANQVQTQAQTLQSQASDGMFATPAVTQNLMPMVLAKESDGGLLAKGRDLAVHNFVSAFDDCATPADRMTKEAGQIVSVGTDARKNLVPTIAQADQVLQPNGIKTEWAHDAEKQLSDRLNETASTAMRTSAAADITAVAGDIQKLQTRVTTAVAEDKERREVSPGLIQGAEQDVDTGRADIAKQLQAAGAFQKGTPDQVLREPKLDPTDSTKQAHADLDAVAQCLDTGDVDQAGQHLQNVKDLSQQAHQIVADTRQALKDYPATLAERQQRTDAIGQSVPKIYTPALQRIKSTYAPDVLQEVAPEVNAGSTIADSIDRSLADLDQASTQTKTAQSDFDRAYLLTSRDDLNGADQSLKTAQGLLDGVTQAESILAKRQQQAEADLNALDGRMSQTRSNAQAQYVRNHARELLSDAESKFGASQAAVQASPKDPYKADEALKVAENVRTQVEQAIDADHQAYDAAVSAVNSAQSSVAAATAAIAAASGQSWSWSNEQGSASESVDGGDLAAAYASVATAQGYVNSAQGQLNSQDYEAACSTAQSAESAANTAEVAAAAAVSEAKSRFDAQVSRLQQAEEAAEERRREEEEERQRQEQQSSSSSWSSGSSGGGFSGGGGSGSSGGSF